MVVRTLLALVAFVLTTATGLRAAEPKDEIKLQTIKAGEVEKAIAAHKGKVVVLDVWGEF
jgi:hypothetical protein